jgi:hypothetical protein
MTTTAETRTEFENVSDGVIGAMVADGNGRMTGIPVRPGDTVWLTEAEEIATANASRKAEDNPFEKGWLRVKTLAADVINRRPIGSRMDGATAVAPAPPTVPAPSDERELPRVEREGQSDETGAPPLPEGDPALGARSPGEEVATPQAVPSGKRPAKQRGQTVKTTPPGGERDAGPKQGAATAVTVGQGGARYVEPPSGE